jgi:hypothetical protein
MGMDGLLESFPHPLATLGSSFVAFAAVELLSGIQTTLNLDISPASFVICLSADCKSIVCFFSPWLNLGAGGASCS